MKQYRITSQNFVHQGETGDADAVMDPQDLHELKKLAGITGLLESEPGMYGGVDVPQAVEGGIVSPIGTTVNNDSMSRRDLEKEFAVQPGTDLWFIINFTKPTPAKSVRAHVEDYLKSHPQYRPKQRPSS